VVHDENEENVENADADARRGGAGGGTDAGTATATACGDNGTSTGAEGDGTGTIEFWDNNGGVRTGIWRQIIADFEDQHPDIDVRYVGVPIDQAGLEPPTTWENFYTAAETLTAGDSNEFGFTIRGGSGSIAQDFLDDLAGQLNEAQAEWQER
jgi:multiple sugar transport system substrate-binding protein